MIKKSNNRSSYVPPIVTIASENDMGPEGKVTVGVAETLTKAPS